jgi:hypothetical protein
LRSSVPLQEAWLLWGEDERARGATLQGDDDGLRSLSGVGDNTRDAGVPSVCVSAYLKAVATSRHSEVVTGARECLRRSASDPPSSTAGAPEEQADVNESALAFEVEFTVVDVLARKEA